MEPIIRKPYVGNAPLVSILLQTHERPHWCEIALRSALSQSYENIEIVVSDNSNCADTANIVTPYLKQNPCIKYFRVPGVSALENGRNCLRNASGDFVNYLMDDDFFHPDKVLRMMCYALAANSVGLVTSFRQLVDGDANHLDPIAGTEKIFNSDTKIDGRSFGRLILTSGQNLIGEPTTVLFKREAVGEYFGVYGNQQYTVLSDVATWLQIMSRYDCVYIPDTLSYFRLHNGQDQRRIEIKYRANIEWLELLCTAIEQGIYFSDRHSPDDLLSRKVTTCIWYLCSVRDNIRNDAELAARIEKLVLRSLRLLYL